MGRIPRDSVPDLMAVDWRVRRFLPLLALILSPALTRADENALRPVLDLETGAVWASRNEAQVPGDSGTRFSLANGGDFQTRTEPFVRVKAGLTYGRHTLYAVFAPLRLEGSGRSERDIQFRNLTFTADGDARVRYRFDTYRLTYRYTLVSASAFDLAVGATALVRDAEIRLSQPGQATSERNTGFVPLLSLRMALRLGGPFTLSLDGDALAAKQGRAEDVALALEFATGDLVFRGGYRLLEGGTDTSKVYNIAWLNHAVVGVSYRF
jgi:hypothetical protein